MLYGIRLILPLAERLTDKQKTRLDKATNATIPTPRKKNPQTPAELAELPSPSRRVGLRVRRRLAIRALT